MSEDEIRAAIHGARPAQVIDFKPKRKQARGHGGPENLLLCNEGGVMRPCLANAVIILQGSELPLFGGGNPCDQLIAFDELALRACMTRPAPWVAAGDAASQSWPRAWTDVDDLHCTRWLQGLGLLVVPKIVAQAVRAVADGHRFHPVRDYLSGLAWDGIERADHWLIDHLGVEDSDFSRAVGRMWLISAVARVFDPGCRADHTLILEGQQGRLKSTALRTMTSPWFADELAEMGSKDAAQQITGAWCIEIAELDSLLRSEGSTAKAFLTRRIDRYRPPYGDKVAEFPRQCVFCASTNAAFYLRDETGGRRFWPIEVGVVDIGGLAAARDQLWAEATVRYRRSEPWWFDVDGEAVASAEVASRYEGDAWADRIVPVISTRYAITVVEILDEILKLPVVQWDRSAQTRVGRILRNLGWVKKERGTGSARKRWYEPPPNWKAEAVSDEGDS